MSQTMYCTACCKLVETVVTEAAASVGPPAMAALFGAATAGRRASIWERIARAGIGAVGTAVVQNFIVPKAQQLACGSCGCTHLLSHAPA